MHKTVQSVLTMVTLPRFKDLNLLLVLDAVEDVGELTIDDAANGVHVTVVLADNTLQLVTALLQRHAEDVDNEWASKGFVATRSLKRRGVAEGWLDAADQLAKLAYRVRNKLSQLCASYYELIECDRALGYRFSVLSENVRVIARAAS